MATAARGRGPRGDDDASTRERMLDVALETFAELGYDGASTREIAARAGVNQGLIPYYFGSKEALWRESVDRAFAELRRGLGDPLEESGGADPRLRLEQLIRRLVRFIARHPEFVRMMHDEGKREGPRMRWLVDRHVRPLYESTRAFAEQAGRLGRLPASIDPLHLHYIAIGAATVIFHQAPECKRLSGHDPREEAIVEAHADALVALLLG